MAAAPGSVPSPFRVSASLVGITFVNKYYNVLHQSPNVVHRFYTDQSILSRAEAGPNGAIDIVVTQAGINQKIMSLDYGDVTAEIKTVDSLESLNGSVLVMVTGSLTSHVRGKRNFVQTFFLAPQEVGFFVLNDMFRYLDDPMEPSQPSPSIPTSNGTSEQHLQSMKQGRSDLPSSPPQISVNHAAAAFEGAISEIEHDPVAVAEERSVADFQCSEYADDLSPPEAVDVVQSYEEEQQTTDLEDSNAEDAPKKSYASILRVQGDVSGASAAAATATASPKSTSANAERPLVPLQGVNVTSLASDTITSAFEGSNGGTHELEGDRRSVYVKNLPLNITVGQLEEEFMKFGAIKPGCINLRNQRVGVCFAFIEFVESSAAESAIAASPISINGRQVYVEEKKSTTTSQRGGRGRFNQRAYQNDGMGGKAHFGGRGFQRNGQTYGGEPVYNSNGGRVGRNVPLMSSSNFNGANGFRRVDKEGSGGLRSARSAGNARASE